MNTGTKSVLFGAHQFLIHPWFVAWAWWKLYGFPWDPRLWVAFFVHDLGYIGKPNMDGPEGKRHVELGALIMWNLFDWTHAKYRRIDISGKSDAAAIEEIMQWCKANQGQVLLVTEHTAYVRRWVNDCEWHDFCLYHSRFYAKRDGKPFSRLCVADKLAIALTPAWLYLPLARATGEIHEYMKLAKGAGAASKYVSMNIWSPEQRQWYTNVQEYLRRWVGEHCDGRADTWTPDVRKAITDSGVWQ